MVSRERKGFEKKRQIKRKHIDNTSSELCVFGILCKQMSEWDSADVYRIEMKEFFAIAFCVVGSK